VPGHHVHRVRRRRTREHQDRRHRRCVRTGADWTVRDGWRPIARCLDDHRD
jgi:hypothetical protein